MNLINEFSDQKEFLNYRDFVRQVLENNGVNVKSRRVDEIAAQLAGARNFNTAMGMVKPRADDLLTPDTYKMPLEIKGATAPNALLLAWDSVISGLVSGGYIAEADKDLMMDEAVDELVGTSQWISDNVNNQGQFTQLVHINRAHSLPLMWERVSDATGVTVAHLKECVEAAQKQILDDPENSTEPFDICSITHY